MSWSANLFFFLLIAYLAYVLAAGDAPKWKKIFTTTIPKPGASGSSGAGGGLPSIGQPNANKAPSIAGQPSSGAAPLPVTPGY